MKAESVKPMSVGRGDERFPESSSDSRGGAVRIEKTFMKMAQLDRVEAIDFGKESLTD